MITYTKIYFQRIYFRLVFGVQRTFNHSLKAEINVSYVVSGRNDT